MGEKKTGEGDAKLRKQKRNLQKPISEVAHGEGTNMIVID